MMSILQIFLLIVMLILTCANVVLNALAVCRLYRHAERDGLDERVERAQRDFMDEGVEGIMTFSVRGMTGFEAADQMKE